MSIWDDIPDSMMSTGAAREFLEELDEDPERRVKNPPQYIRKRVNKPAYVPIGACKQFNDAWYKFWRKRGLCRWYINHMSHTLTYASPVGDDPFDFYVPS